MSYRSRKIRLHKRALPIKGKDLGGDNNDANRYFRCKHCGFIVDSRKAALGDGDGRFIQDYAFEDPNKMLRFPSLIFQKGGYENGQQNYASMMTINYVDHNHEGLMENGSDGTPMPIRHDHYVAGGTGCPLCHSLAWR
jgi:hypothetical protein